MRNMQCSPRCKIIFLLIAVLLLAACARPPSLKSGNKSVKIETKANVSVDIPKNDTSTPKENASSETPVDSGGSEEPEETPDEDPVIEVQADRVDVHIARSAGGNKSEVTSVFGGKTQKYTLAEGDKDAVIFEIAKKEGKPLKLIRSVTYFDGIAYLRPSERASFTEAVSTETDATIEAAEIPLFIEKDDGFIRGIGCSLEKGILRVKLHNDGEKDFPFYRDVRPRIKGALVVTLNTRVLAGLYCGGKEVLKAGASLDCVKSNTLFVRTRQKVGLNENATDTAKVKDLLVAYYPGYFERVDFDCAPGNKLLPKVNATATNASSTKTVNVTVNATANASANRTVNATSNSTSNSS